MTQMPAGDVPGMGRRQFMNLLTFGSVTGVALGALYPVVNYFIPPRAAGSGGGTSAKDELGNAVTARSSRGRPTTPFNSAETFGRLK